MKLTQRELVLEYIKKFGSITRAEAFIDLGIAELSARICELTQRGYKFKRDTVTVKTRLGETKHVTRYSLEEETA